MLPGQLCHIFIFRFPVDDAKAFRFFDSDLTPGGLYPLCLTAPLSVQDMAAWLLEAFCIVAVRCVYDDQWIIFYAKALFQTEQACLRCGCSCGCILRASACWAVVTGIVPAAGSEYALLSRHILCSHGHHRALLAPDRIW